MRLLAVLVVALLAAQPVAAETGRPVSGPIVFRPAEGTILDVAGRGPHRGSMEVRGGSSGLTVVNQVDLEQYVMGLAEVPGSWPMNALKAQAVAARTYVLWEKENGAWRKDGFDVCATTACQVYHGVRSEQGDLGRRWVEAVRATEGEVLLYRDKPALARYHSTSGGQTLANHTVFPRSGRFSYLSSVRDPADRASPLHRWSVFFTRAQMTAIVQDALGLGGEVQDVVNDETTRRVVVRTSGGERELSTPSFREAVSRVAPDLFPATFPGPRPDGRTMPLTLPSSRFVVTAGESGFTFAGRGYGHGVGMSQWGAKGRADRGDDYRDILAAYYEGLTVTRWAGSTTLRVGLTRTARAATVSGSGAFSVSSAADELTGSTVGRWTVTPRSGRTLTVRPPEGYSVPLVLSGLRAPQRVVVQSGILEAAAQVSFVIPKAAQVDAVLTRGGLRVGEGRGVFEAGEGRVRVAIPDAGRLDPRDSYELRVTAFDGTARVSRTSALTIERVGSGQRTLPVSAGLLLALLALASVAWWRRARVHQIEPDDAAARRAPALESVLVDDEPAPAR